ncbi:MAG: nucleoside-diphosphate kinase [Cardiobacteriaceae bacterium]|nr:nucleoside-diphosphate kinase [Cardiobacteriaceae bacterium]
MPAQMTLSIIKPDAVQNHHTGAILARLEQNGLEIVAAKMLRLSNEDAAHFYDVHRERPFFAELVEFMTSGPVMVQVLRGDDAVVRYCELMGATDPAEAAKGTLRAEFAENKGRNAVHGSDSVENAMREIAFFFAERELCR